jgi:orotidine-5'-phosphate decarboxylase
MTSYDDSSRLIVALDFHDAPTALRFVDQLAPHSCRVKVGKELFTREGPAIVDALIQRGFDVFLDLKFHDIPNTTAQAIKAAAELGVWMVNVHASGGRRMMEASKEVLEKVNGKKPLLIAVTVLTSMDENDLTEIGFNGSPLDQVMRLSHLAKESGLDGVVCSAHEASYLRKTFSAFVLVTPGIRPLATDITDQKRVVTPEQAISLGSDYLVVGRPITASQNPMSVIASIQSAISKN